MLNFCTLFDSAYLSRGLAMYESLRTHSEDFHLYIFAFDDLTFKILINLNLRQVTVISLNQFENQKLLSIKKDRTTVEYCWTCTSSTIAYVLDNYKPECCTYLDADLFFYKSPSVMLKELNSAKTVLITEHRYSWLSRIYEQKRAGRYCVQFISFMNRENSRLILDRWINQCIDWCYSRFEEGRFGDQKYLDEWPTLYDNVMVSEQKGAGVAPWNINQYEINNYDNNLTGTQKKTKTQFEIIFYHFHYVKFLSNGNIDLGWNRLPKKAINEIYVPYMRILMNIEKRLLSSFGDYKTTYYKTNPSGPKDVIKHIFKKFTGFNVINSVILDENYLP